MRTLSCWVGILCGLTLTPLLAQDNSLPAPRRQAGLDAEATATARSQESYERYETTRQAIYRRAATKAAQRRERLAINKALGYSPLRPPASPVPFMGSYGSRPIVVRYTPFLGTYYPVR